MSLLDQIEEILEHLEAAQDELQFWVDVNENENLGVEDEYSQELIHKISSMLHEIKPQLKRS